MIVPIAQALADRLGVKLELVGHPAPPVLIDCLKAGDCDIGFLGFTQARTKNVDYATPHIMVPFTYLVPANSPIRSIADADKPGVRIVGRPQSRLDPRAPRRHQARHDDRRRNSG